MTNTLYILHGRDSSPDSRKCQLFSAIARKHGWKAVIPDFRGIDSPDARLEHFLDKHLDDERPGKVVVVGSSMGAYIALEASKAFAVDTLVLLSPAIYLPGYAVTDPVPEANRTILVHGWCDAVVSPSFAVRFADRHKCELHLLDDAHDLGNSLDFLEGLLDTTLAGLQLMPRLKRLTPML